MPSRRKRKRERQLAEATASNPKRRGGWGEGYPVAPRDLLLVRQAIREVWDIPPDVCDAVVNDVYAVASSAEKPRRLLAAVRVFIDMERENERNELAARGLGHLLGGRGSVLRQVRSCGAIPAPTLTPPQPSPEPVLYMCLAAYTAAWVRRCSPSLASSAET